MTGLIKLGADVHLQDYVTYKVLHRDFIQNHLSTVKTLVKSGTDVHKRDKKGLTALHVACWGSADLVVYLLRSGSEVSEECDKGHNALHFACSFGNKASVDLLVRNGIDVNKRNNDGLAPMHIAANNKYTYVLRTLLEGNAFPDVKDDTGRTALLIASEINRSKIVTLLLQHGPSVKTLVVTLLYTRQ